MTSLQGKAIKWTFSDGPDPGTTFEHVFHENGSVTWRIASGPHQGATATEKAFAGERVNDRTWAISYLGASGHTLTVILNLDDQRVVAFASNDKAWYTLHGTFEIVR